MVDDVADAASAVPVAVDAAVFVPRTVAVVAGAAGCETDPSALATLPLLLRADTGSGDVAPVLALPSCV